MKTNRITEFLKVMQKISKDKGLTLEFEAILVSVNDCFSVYEINAYEDENVKDFHLDTIKFLENKLQELSKSLGKVCLINIKLLSKDESIRDYFSLPVFLREPGRDGAIRLDELGLNKAESKESHLGRLEFKIFTDGSIILRKMEKTNLGKINEYLEELKNSLRIFSSEEEYFNEHDGEYKNTNQKKDELNLLRSDIERIKTSNYFSKFLQGSRKTKQSISIYYENGSNNRNLINVFHQGYGFRWNDYIYDELDLSKFNFETIHTYEDLSWLASTASEYFSNIIYNSKLDGRGTTEITKGKQLKLLPIFKRYFSEEIIDTLEDHVEFEIFLEKGLVSELIVVKTDSDDVVVGFNNNGEKVFTLSLTGEEVVEIVPLEPLKDSVNKFLKEFEIN